MKKMAIGYIVIIFIPIISFGLFLYNQNYNSFLDEYAQGRQKIVNQVLNNLNVSTVQIESAYQLFQNNSNTIAYLSGNYRTDFEQVSNFLTYIRPLFSYILSSNRLIDGMTIYMEQQNGMVFRPEMAKMDESKLDESIKKLPLGVGKWITINNGANPDINLHFVHKIGNRNFEQDIGLLDIKVTSKLIKPLLESLNLNNKSNLYVLDQDHQVISLVKKIPLSQDSEQALFADVFQSNAKFSYQQVNGNKMLIESFYAESLKLQFVMIEQVDDVFIGIKKNKYVLVLTVSILLLLLSGIYYLIASSITKRILKLSKHMRQVDENHFPLYHGEINKDEVGHLTSAYNAMIRRMDELVNTVHRSEMLRKESAYLMMQAQIKPHFLYNTLESIRMIAETNDDPEAAEMSYTLGKLFRYSLSGTKSETSLREEVENVQDYIKIQQIRLADRLQVSCDIDADIDNFHCPHYMLQPIIENSIVHGIANVRKQGSLSIRIWEDSAFMFISVEDSGAGIEEERLVIIQCVLNGKMDVHHLQTDGGGLGIFNVNERVKMFFGERSGIQLESKLNVGTTCILKLAKGAAQ
ncbi:sensor histidine kinase [Paenibacillus alginolyticus]|uniref:histidine kinase n=1 Tax=Paenibacillus alginolyticus TaxID=59839 RepID=A0ABT4GBQ3_9BACL|nr:histidine kinase [Paenibacillus alginolyticus]MCY9693606.1 histidine kinase [Paenibacillus alginolyticus]MEC0146643.1 histidine kinase [Paenibacillus alginolyticus]